MEIYGTIGPSCEDTEILQQMFQKGMTGIRLNLSHSSLRESEAWMNHIKEASEKVGMIPQILIDLQGPELRVGQRENGEKGWELIEESEVILTDLKEDGIPLPSCIFPYLMKGQEILLDDGKILLTVDECSPISTKAKVVRGGWLKPRKSVAIPGIEILNPTLTEEDIENIQCIKEYGVTGVMLPFVRNAKDIQNLREVLVEASASNVKIYAKIENMTGVSALEELIPHADHIVIARGDLGNSMPLWELPAIQKNIAKKCKENKMPFMVVTQMLASMEKSKVPTRAEISDIYNAILDGASSVMLTGETAVGEFPVEAITYLVNTVRSAEKYN